ncbi:RNA polymerase subunit sigma-24, partial [Candidatus Pacebacteria bacterium]|nr:RNA polymerase subunit sigma-24 [Candidatus Paceibacterota bacterium]
ESQSEYQEVLAHIASMEEPDRLVLMMKYVDGLPPKEIASILCETANVISVRINRAEKRLKERINHV